MTAKNKGLKKGALEFLLSSSGLDDVAVLDELAQQAESKNSNTKATKSQVKHNSLVMAAIEKIQRSPYQPRKNFDAKNLTELSESIKAKGLIQPLIVRKTKDSELFELIAGERRWRACQLAGLHEVPVVVKEVDDTTAMVMAIVENIQREDLNPIEEANGLQRLITEFSMTQQEVAEVIGRSRSAVTNLIRLLALSPEVKAMVEDGRLEMGHARALLSLDVEQQLMLAHKIIDKKASVRDVETWVRTAIQTEDGTYKEKPKELYVQDPNITSLQTKISESLGASVSINHSRSGSGELVIKYHNIDQLDGIIAKIH